MKALLAPTLVTSSFATIVLCGLAAAPSFTSPYKPHRFENIDVSWTDTPVRVDRAAQNYERLAAAPVPQSFANQPRRFPVAGATIAAPAIEQNDSSDVQACRAKYRSYRAEDNTYQPLDGGPRLACKIVMQIGKGMVKVDFAGRAASGRVAASSGADSEVWCAARYSSYDPKDGTYQPFGGGARKLCISPGGLASNG